LQIIQKLSFKPFPFLKNPHLQTILPGFLFKGASPLSKPYLINLEDGDTLSCEVSTPPTWNSSKKTVFLIHGLGGSHNSNYMIRLSRKTYRSQHRAVRINLRGCGSGKGLTKKPFHSGKADDILQVLQFFKKETPNSPFVLIGFSVGGNLALKLAGELGEEAQNLLLKTIAVCPPIDLAKSVSLLESPSLKIYHKSYVKSLKNYGKKWIQGKSISSIYEFDNQITSSLWDFQNAEDFYKKSSSMFFIPHIKHTCHIIFAEDDPLVHYQSIFEQEIPDCVRVWTSPHGGHMGFLGGLNQKFYWLDSLLLSWI
jgi:uncharacterized protein